MTGTPATPAYVDDITNGCGTRVYTFNITDCAGHSHAWTYTYTITPADFAAPTAGASTVACVADATPPAAPTVTSCGITLTGTPATPAYVDDITNGCGTRVYTFNITDCAGHSHAWTYTYTITPADFAAPTAGASTVACVADATPPAAPTVTLAA